MGPKQILDMARSLTGGKGGEIELPAPQGLFDRFINAVNRLGRPLLLIGAVLFFIWGIMDPVGFVATMKAFAETPEWITTAILLVISIFGTGRVIRDFKTKQTVKTTVEHTEEVSTEEAPPTNRTFDNLEDDDDEDLEDIPAENSAIDQWKKDADSKAS